MMVKDYSLWLNWEQNTLFSCLKYYCTYENVHRYGFLTDTQKRDTHIRAHDKRVDKQTWTQSTLTHTYTPYTQTHTAYTPHTHMHPSYPHACTHMHVRMHTCVHTETEIWQKSTVHSELKHIWQIHTVHSEPGLIGQKYLRKHLKQQGRLGVNMYFFQNPSGRVFFFFT